MEVVEVEYNQNDESSLKGLILFDYLCDASKTLLQVLLLILLIRYDFRV